MDRRYLPGTESLKPALTALLGTVAAIGLALMPNVVQGTEIFVPDNGTLSNLASIAINGDIITIRKGTYDPGGSVIVVNKTITIRGEDPDSSRVVSTGSGLFTFVSSTSQPNPQVNSSLLENLVINLQGNDVTGIAINGSPGLACRPTIRNVKIGNGPLTQAPTYVIRNNQNSAATYENILVAGFVTGWGGAGNSAAEVNGITLDPAELQYTVPGVVADPHRFDGFAFRTIVTSQTFGGQLSNVAIVNPYSAPEPALQLMGTASVIDTLIVNYSTGAPIIDLLRVGNLDQPDSPCPWDYFADVTGTAVKQRIIVNGDTLSACPSSGVPETAIGHPKLAVQTLGDGRILFSLSNTTRGPQVAEFRGYNVAGQLKYHGEPRLLLPGQSTSWIVDPGQLMLPSGIYFGKASVGAEAATAKWVVVR